MITISEIENTEGVTTVYAVFPAPGGGYAVCAQSFATLKAGAEYRKRQAEEKGEPPKDFENWFFTREEAQKYNPQGEQK